MRKNDIVFTLILSLSILVFLPYNFLESFQNTFLFNSKYWLLTSFLKFALLSTLGESLGLRLKKGVYNQKNFGLIPRAIVWGLLGIAIKIAFEIFAIGTPALLSHSFGIVNAVESMKNNSIFDAINVGLGGTRLLTAFCISAFLNLIFAPVFMTLHKITDMHIVENQGTIKGFFSPIKFYKIFPTLNWSVQWEFVFKRTIPFFWIPAHTITFLLAPQYRIAFAAFLGIILGLLLTIAAQKSRD
ncbi:MAG: hypothetical protein AUJ98_07985 [Bacteroidetes bacterium CG2_30_33_31]|nr:MAG: hypothetical protein AUJ98_07985 [Bacteroidetes bacterium CG2_30_33_31]